MSSLQNSATDPRCVTKLRSSRPESTTHAPCSFSGLAFGACGVCASIFTYEVYILNEQHPHERRMCREGTRAYTGKLRPPNPIPVPPDLMLTRPGLRPLHSVLVQFSLHELPHFVAPYAGVQNTCLVGVRRGRRRLRRCSSVPPRRRNNLGRRPRCYNWLCLVEAIGVDGEVCGGAPEHYADWLADKGVLCAVQSIVVRGGGIAGTGAFVRWRVELESRLMSACRRNPRGDGGGGVAVSASVHAAARAPV